MNSLQKKIDIELELLKNNCKYNILKIIDFHNKDQFCRLNGKKCKEKCKSFVFIQKK